MDDETRLRKFFVEYANRFNQALGGRADARGTTRAFAEYFVAASPRGVQGGRNGLLFRLAVPFGYRYYRRIGTTSMTISDLALSRLDDGHWMAKARWHSTYVRRRDQKPVAIDFDVTYFLQIRAGHPRIFAYITGDEEKALQENGLL